MDWGPYKSGILGSGPSGPMPRFGPARSRVSSSTSRARLFVITHYGRLVVIGRSTGRRCAAVARVRAEHPGGERCFKTARVRSSRSVAERASR